MEFSMEIVSISIHDLSLLSLYRSNYVVLVTAEWVPHKDHQLLLNKLKEAGLYRIYQLKSKGSDEIEDIAINTFGVDALPAAMLYHYNDIQSTDMEIDSTPWTLWRGDIALESYNFRRSGHVDGPLVSSLLGFDGQVAVDTMPSRPLVLFVAGDKSSVGKSSLCLAIIAALIRSGCPPSLLAYIKPVTQCEATQPIVRYCSRVGVANVGIGPVVFYKGFTRSYLNGETESAAQLLNHVRRAVQEIGAGRRFILVDGVGYPSVGSICSLSNADVARSIAAPVLLVGKQGVGDAVDSFNLNATFFRAHGVPVLGCIFNKLPATGFYSLNECKAAIDLYFKQYQPGTAVYGYMPLLEAQSQTGEAAAGLSDSEESVNILVEVFLSHVSIQQLFSDLYITQLHSQNQSVLQRENPHQGASCNRQPNFVPPVSSSHLIPTSPPRVIVSEDSAANVSRKRSREEIEAEARSKGAVGG